MRTPSINSQDDPLSAAIKPPPTESEAERAERLKAEAEARRISDQIDEDLRLERERKKKGKDDVKLLLLGQAESGKSTLQKQFQLMYKPQSLELERSSWKTVIYFNIVRSLRHILSTLESWDDSLDGLRRPSEPQLTWTQPEQTSDEIQLSSRTNGDQRERARPTSNSSNHHKFNSSSTVIANIRLRLSPLIVSDEQLADKLSGGIQVSGAARNAAYVRSGWQTRALEQAFGRLKPKRASADGERRSRDSTSTTYSQEMPPDPLIEEVANMLEHFKDDIWQLWEHPVTRGLISRRKLKLDEWSEFFLQHIGRIATRNYVPTTDDILHARVQTIGVSEHVFDVTIHGKIVSWHLYDVGGARGQRHTWVPFFDDANAIIFVAPVSAFDQYLEEDPQTNRIDDSLQLFTQICANPLLKSVHLVLFLNKTDLLKAKLDSGLMVRKYITSFGDRPNEYESVIQYFRAHFLQVHRKNNENRRVLYTHFTSVVDTKATQRIIGNVRDSIFRGYLQSAALV
ncbi:hypothetical protein AX16_003847 [Volvariella volvacea WC 439]|nr:hypothetical protein AX16_003847 [Volvariella volvacea WC 439]